MITAQTFGSALRCPWALAIHGANAPVGRRPGTSVFYITDDEGTHYLGGFVEYYRARGRLVRTESGFKLVGDEPQARWHYRYKHAKRIAKCDVLHHFPHINKSPFGGPTQTEVRRARKALPITTAEQADAEDTRRREEYAA